MIEADGYHIIVLVGMCHYSRFGYSRSPSLFEQEANASSNC